MSHESSDMDPRLERSLEDIRNEAIDPAMVEGAAQRVRSKLAAEPAHRISGCADFQALIPAWKAGELSEAKALLLKDHLHECVACRRAMEARPRPVVTLPVRPAMPPRRWLAIAAAVTVTAGLGTWGTFYRYAPAPERSRAVVESLEGTLYRVSADGASPLHRGEELAGGAEVRTGSASRAMLRLGDGSWVEMKERSAFTVSATRRELTVNLGRGSVLVQAAKRRTGHLYVASKDCRVEVTGTVFHVNGGTKGARVSVIEGEVRVSAGGDRKVLHSGDQYASNASVGTAPVEDEIAWSANIEKHMVLLREFSALGKDLAKVPLPGLRYSSRLLDLAPRRTAVFASIPNLGEALGGAHEIIRQRVQSSPVLQEWWQSDGGKHFDETIRELREVSQYLGDEIVMAASLDANGRLGAPVFLAETRRGGLREHLQAKFGSGKEGLVELGPDVLALAPEPGQMRHFGGGFAGTAFHARLAQAYREGAGFLFSADLEQLASNPRSKLFGNFRHVVVEQKESGGATTTQATLTFHGARQGLASWLAGAAPMSVLDYISPDAGLAAAFVIQNPAVLIEELFALARTQDPNFDQTLTEVESKLGVSIRNDLAASLGNEIAVALDGPALPVPAWKVAAEVINAGRMQWAIQKIVEGTNREISSRGQGTIGLTQQVVNGRTYYTISASEGSKLMEAHYTFVDGYLLAASSRALIDQAMQSRATGYSLPRSQGFQALLPRDGRANFSGMIYHNLGSTLGALADTAGRVLDPRQREIVEGISKGMKPTLFTLQGEADSIRIATNGSLVGMTLDNLAGLQGPLSVMQMIGGKKRPRQLQ